MRCWFCDAYIEESRNCCDQCDAPRILNEDANSDKFRKLLAIEGRDYLNRQFSRERPIEFYSDRLELFAFIKISSDLIRERDHLKAELGEVKAQARNNRTAIDARLKRLEKELLRLKKRK